MVPRISPSASNQQLGNNYHMVEGVGVHLDAVECTMEMEVEEGGDTGVALSQDFLGVGTESGCNIPL